MTRRKHEDRAPLGRAMPCSRKEEERDIMEFKWTENAAVDLPQDAAEALAKAPRVTLPRSREELVDWAVGDADQDLFNVSYDVPGKGEVLEATVARCRNGLAVNYTEAYMRRRDPDCMLVADDDPTDKERYRDRFGVSFSDLRGEVMDWLATQDLVLLPFWAGAQDQGHAALLIAPRNASFFAGGLADLQGMIPVEDLPASFKPQAVLYLAPPFRHTHCDGKQVVVHQRGDVHEIFSLNLYPGPSAKKGVYGVLLTIGEKEGWVTIHGSTVRVVTPYDNEVVITHEGASGGGKSEMLEYPHRAPDGRLRLAANTVTGERRHMVLNQGCVLEPVTDDMALSLPDLPGDNRIVVADAEDAWFVRVNHVPHYGVDPHLEYLTIHPPEPLIFLNVAGVPKSTILIWEATEDAPGEPCPNPRVILPRRVVPDIVDGAVPVDIRSFGVRTPPCTAEKPSYGIMGMLHVLPPALAWLWRLVAPRGHANPSIVDTAGMSSEGVGSYWPFATGRFIDQANLLLEQIRKHPGTRYTLCPNQHVGAWEVGFMPQWITREYLARRGGAKFKADQLAPARCPLLGYALRTMQVEGVQIPHLLLEVDVQPEVGTAGYDAGAKILQNFFAKELEAYRDNPDLDAQGHEIVACCLDGGTLEQYEALMER